MFEQMFPTAHAWIHCLVSYGVWNTNTRHPGNGCAYPRMALLKHVIYRRYITHSMGESWVNPLPYEASRTKWGPEKKDPLCGFFLTGLQLVLPLSQ